MKELKANLKKGRTREYKWRIDNLKSLLNGFTEMKREFEESLFQDLGRSANASAGEIMFVTGTIQHDLKHLWSYMKPVSEDTELVLAPANTVITYEPMGICAIFSAWNYPIITALKPLIQAITTGNAVIMKPSEIAANTSAVIKKLFDRCLDPDYFRCIEGGIDVAVKLNNQKLDLLCFTGSTQVGRIVAGVAAKNLTKCILELGGKCPAVVHATCDLVHTVEKLCFAKFSNSGQTCIAPDYLFVHEKVVKKFIPLMI